MSLEYEGGGLQISEDLCDQKSWRNKRNDTLVKVVFGATFATSKLGLIL